MNMVQNEYPSCPLTTPQQQVQAQPGMQALQPFTIPKVSQTINGQQLVPQVIQNADGTHSVHDMAQPGNINKSNSQSLPNLDGIMLFDYTTDGTDSSSESSFQVSMAPTTSQVPVVNYNTMETHIQQTSNNKRQAEPSNEQQAQKKKKKMAQSTNSAILAQTPPCQV
jgi:hypothetical protein